MNYIKDEGPDLTFHDLHPDYQEYEPCAWHRLVMQIKRKLIKAHQLNILQCHEEGTEVVERIEEDYPVCKKHKRIYEGLWRG